MGSMIAKKDIPAAGQPQPFPQKANISLPVSFSYAGQEYTTQQYLDSSYTQGLLIIQNDTIVYEDYARGQTAETPHISWSVAKSFISALFGIAMEEGHIKSVEQKVEEYLPELIGSGYEGVRIKDVLQMSSGVGFDENYLSRILSAGTLGVKTQRKLVPTRWSITATDDTIGKELISQVKDCAQGEYWAWFGGYLGNYFLEIGQT